LNWPYIFIYLISSIPIDSTKWAIFYPNMKNLHNWYLLIDYLRFYVLLKNIFHLYGDVTIAGEGLQNLGLCSALRAFEQGEIVIVPHLLWHGASVFPVLSEGPPHLVASYNTQGMWRIYSNPDPHGASTESYAYIYQSYILMNKKNQYKVFFALYQIKMCREKH
jgi:hypothetical protein